MVSRPPGSRLVETRLRGWIDPYAGLNAFDFTRLPPSPDLSPYLHHYWVVTWQTLAEPYEQRIVSHPTVNMTITRDFHRIAGVIRGGFSYTMKDSGRVIGVRFRPGGFRPLYRAPVSELTGRFVEIPDLYGEAGTTLVDQVLGEPDHKLAIAAIETFLRTLGPRPDPLAEEAAELVELAESTVTITRADDLAARSGRSLRSLQRLFRDYVGISPKWVIRRFRLHEAAERIQQGLDLATLAAELGYTDQAHLTRDFTGAVGMAPAAYARLSAEPAPSSSAGTPRPPSRQPRRR